MMVLIGRNLVVRLNQSSRLVIGLYTAEMILQGLKDCETCYEEEKERKSQNPRLKVNPLEGYHYKNYLARTWDVSEESYDAKDLYQTQYVVWSNFDMEKQDVHAGGSGCGCSAITLCGYLLDKVSSGKYKRILFCGTGALLSPTSSQQGLPIPAVCHAVSIMGGK